MKAEVIREFDGHLSTLFKERVDLLRFIRNHERKPLVIDNICEEISKIEAGTFSIRFDIEKHKVLVQTGAQLFANAVFNHAEQKMISDLEKERQRKEAEHFEDLQAVFEEETTTTVEEYHG